MSTAFRNRVAGSRARANGSHAALVPEPSGPTLGYYGPSAGFRTPRTPWCRGKRGPFRPKSLRISRRNTGCTSLNVQLRVPAEGIPLHFLLQSRCRHEQRHHACLRLVRQSRWPVRLCAIQPFDGFSHSGEKHIMDRPDTTLSPAHAAILDKLIALVHAAGPLEAQTDKYFTNTSRIVAAHGDTEVTFAVFMRRRVVAALEPAIRLARALVPDVKIRRLVQEGEVVPSERKLMEITGSMKKLSEVETVLLQKIGFPCVCANNAYEMCLAMPDSGFMDMHARHASGAEMNILAAYGAMVGSVAARRHNANAKGFVGSSQT